VKETDDDLVYIDERGKGRKGTERDKMKIHVFEQAGLGKAPFRYKGCGREVYQVVGGPAQPGGTCDYCGTAITNCFYLESADKKSFKVGCNCVEKTGDHGLINPVKQEVNRLKSIARNERELVRIQEGRIRLPLVLTALKAKKHPNTWLAAKGETADAWAIWMMANAGNAGRLQVCRTIKKILKGTKP